MDKKEVLKILREIYGDFPDEDVEKTHATMGGRPVWRFFMDGMGSPMFYIEMGDDLRQAIGDEYFAIMEQFI